jgi:hypothetical protein
MLRIFLNILSSLEYNALWTYDIYVVRPTRLYSSVPKPETGTPKLFWRGTERVKITRESNLPQDQLSVPHDPGE